MSRFRETRQTGLIETRRDDVPIRLTDGGIGSPGAFVVA